MRVPSRPGTVCRNVLLLMMFCWAATSLPGQTAGAKKGSAPPANWKEKWSGWYAGARGEVPAGFTILNPSTGLDAIIIPLLQPWAAARREATDFDVEEVGQVCGPSGLLLSNQNANFEFLVSPGRITMVQADRFYTGGTRRIYLDRPHLKNPPLSWYGDSVAQWEGDTLVVDTTGFNDKTFLSADATRHSSDLHIVERWRLVANGTFMEREWTVDDPRALKAPFKFRRYHKKMPADMRAAEEACLDTPQGKQGWVEIHNRGVRDRNAARAEEAKEITSQAGKAKQKASETTGERPEPYRN